MLFLQFKFNRQRPDLTKLDNLLGLLSTESSNLFEDRLEQLQNQFRQDGADAVITDLLKKEQRENPSAME